MTEQASRAAELVATVTIGTAPDCQVILEDVYASNHHARLYLYADGAVFVEDLFSTNGTFIVPQGTRLPGNLGLAGERVKGVTQLHRGDVLRVGRTVIPWSHRP